MRKIISILLLLSLIAFIIYRAALGGYIRLNYPSFEKHPVHGIDISHHQYDINWDILDKRYVQFAFIKSTEGATHQDSKFRENWNEAKKHNIPTSAYHFFTFCTSGTEQAQNYINTVPNDSSSLPPALDLEYGGNCKEENRLTDLHKEINDYITTIELHYKKRVIIYATRDFYDAHIAHRYPNNPIWIRDIISEPTLESNREWLFWQYANRGKLNGIETHVDLNAYAGNRDKLQKLVESYVE